MTDDAMLAWLRKCEGYNSHPYLDSVGKVTIGFGRNLDANGVSLDEAEHMLKNDLDHTLGQLWSRLPWFASQPESIKDALTNMAFNLGFEGLLEFKDMIEAIIAKNYTKAAQEALDSKWAKQVGQRAKDIAVMIREAI